MKNIIIFLACILLVKFAYANESNRDIPDPQKIIDAYNNAECCIFIDQLKPTKLDKRTRLDLYLYESKNLLELSTGPTFAALVEIPLSNKKERYEVETNVMHVGDDLYVYFPYVAFLNDELKLLGTSDFTHSNYSGKSLFQPTGILNFNFNLDPNLKGDEAVRYLLIYTRKKHFSQNTTDQLKEESRNVRLKEISLEYANTVSEYIQRDLLYGLPGGKVSVSNKGKFF